jgi:arginyl-tRNA synthetase
MSEIYLGLKEKLSVWQPEIASTNQQKVDWQLPTELEHGLFTTNIAFLLAKSLRQNPNQIAQDLKADLDEFLASNSLPLESIQVGPYINLKLKDEFFVELIKSETLSSPAQNALNKIEKTVLLDYVSPNVAKPLHAGHIRNANLGESLRRLFNLKYKKVITECYWGDWGVQFGILLWAWKQFLERKSIQVTINGVLETVSTEDINNAPIDTMVRIYVWGNQVKEQTENWDEIVRNEFLALEAGNQENRELWSMFLDISKQNMAKELAVLNLPKFDLEQGESYFETEFLALADFLESQDLWNREQKARFIDLEDISTAWENISDEKRKLVKSFGRCYLISSTGYSSYALRDMSARISWVKNIQADLMITVTGNEQKHHFEQFISIICYLATLPSFINHYSKDLAQKLITDNIVHISYGFLTLSEGKMSTRKGNILTASDLINQIIEEAKRVILEKNPEKIEVEQKSKIIGVAALKWFDLNRDSSSDLVLDIPKILQFEGNTGVYQLYTYARLRSILRKELSSKSKVQSVEFKVQSEDLFNQAEKLIIQQMYTLPETLEKAVLSYKPHLICNHLYSLCDKINSWYNSTPILKEENEDRKTALLLLVEQMTDHIKFALDLLAIEVLEEI